MKILILFFLILGFTVSCSNTKTSNNNQYKELIARYGIEGALTSVLVKEFFMCNGVAPGSLRTNSKLFNHYANSGYMNKDKTMFWFKGEDKQDSVNFKKNMKYYELNIIGSEFTPFKIQNKEGHYWGFYFKEDIDTVIKTLKKHNIQFKNVLGAMTRILYFNNKFHYINIIEKSEKLGSKTLVTCLYEKINK